MAVSIDSGGRGRRKPVAADLNLVPYIDLLTCMVAFLLITAVWTQIQAMQVRQRGRGEVDGVDQPQTKIAVLVHEDGFAVVVNDESHPVPRQRGEYDYAKLAGELKRAKDGHPDKTDVEVMSADVIRFDTLVRTMDAAMASGFPDVALLDATGAAP